MSVYEFGRSQSLRTSAYYRGIYLESLRQTT